MDGAHERRVPDDRLLDRATDDAHQLATTVSPASMAASKRQAYEAFHLSAAESVGAAESLLGPMMADPDFAEGVAALREKRAPDFADPPGADGSRPLAESAPPATNVVLIRVRSGGTGNLP